MTIEDKNRIIIAHGYIPPDENFRVNNDLLNAIKRRVEYAGINSWFQILRARVKTKKYTKTVMP